MAYPCVLMAPLVRPEQGAFHVRRREMGKYLSLGDLLTYCVRKLYAKAEKSLAANRRFAAAIHKKATLQAIILVN